MLVSKQNTKKGTKRATSLGRYSDESARPRLRCLVASPLDVYHYLLLAECGVVAFRATLHF